MSELDDLYQEIILDHYKRPRNFGALAAANCEAEGYNPLCGDRVKISVRVEDDRVVDLSFEGTGCAISTASASLLTEALKGRTVAEAAELFQRFRHLLTADRELPAGESEELGKLVALAGVRDYPMRVKCATLAWHTLRAALERREKVVTTE